MMCIHCQSKTKVVDSRSTGIAQGSAPLVHTIAHGRRVFGWWTDEFTVRRRKCLSCDRRFWTIEVSISDLRDALTEVKESDTLGKPWRQEPSDTEAREERGERKAVSIQDMARRTQSNLCG